MPERGDVGMVRARIAQWDGPGGDGTAAVAVYVPARGRVYTIGERGISYSAAEVEEAQVAAAIAASLCIAAPARSLRPHTFYHGTNLKAALAIQETGFRVPTGPGGCLGPGVYCTTTLKKAFDYLDCEHGGIVFELEVDLGRCKTLQKDDPQMNTWHSDYDSAWHPTGAVNQSHEGKEENCVKDPKRIKIVRPIAGHTAKLLAAGYEIVGNALVSRSSLR